MGVCVGGYGEILHSQSITEKVINLPYDVNVHEMKEKYFGYTNFSSECLNHMFQSNQSL